MTEIYPARGLQIHITAYCSYSRLPEAEGAGGEEIDATISTHPEVAKIENYWTRNFSGTDFYDAAGDPVHPDVTEAEMDAVGEAVNTFMEVYDEQWAAEGVTDMIERVRARAAEEAGHHIF